MKSILLASTALVAFAGAASAAGHSGIAFSGEATIGTNDVIEDGFYWDAELDVAMTAMLDNGLEVSATFGMNVSDNSLGDPVSTADYVLKVSGGGSSLSFGDLDPVAEDRWDGVDGATVADFNDQDVHFDVAGFEAMLVGETTIAGFTAAVSYGVDGDGATAEDDVDALQAHVSGSFGNFGIEFAYQQEFAGTPTIFGVAASTSFAGADVTLAYIDDETESSIGIGVSYPVGPVVVSGYYSVNDVAEDNYGVEADYSNGPVAVNVFYDFDGDADEGDFGIEGSYDVGNGLMVYAGAIDSGDAMYAAVTYDLGGGASILVSYADDGDDAVDNDEVGDPEYMEGITVEASFAF